MPCPLSFPFGDLEGVAAAPSTLSTPDSDAGLGLFGIRPKKSSYARLQRPSQLFARKGDFICSYHGPIRTIAECVSQPSMYLFSDPLDPQQRYIDSWDPTTGVTSYGGLVNESFQDEQINCTIKWSPGRSTAGIYAKRDILLNEELLTGYGKPQWIYAIHFFPHLLSHHTIQEAKARYHITNQDTLAPQFAQYITQPSSSTAQDPQLHPTPEEPTREPIPAPTQQLPTAAHNTPTPPTALDALIPPAAHTSQHRQQQPINKPTPTISNHQPTDPSSMYIPQQPTTAHATPPLSTDSAATTPTTPTQQLTTTAPNTPTPPTALDAPILPAAHTTQHRQQQPINKPTSTILNHQPTAPTSMATPQQRTTAHGTPPLSADSDATTPQNAHNKNQQLDFLTATLNHSITATNQPMAPTAPSSNFTSSSDQPISNHTAPTLAPPAQVEYPYGYAEGVGVSTSQLPHAGRGLYGLRPHPAAPHLFAKQGQFICIYATQRHQISATTATLSSSRYLWSTNTGNRRNARALYFDAQDAPHYGKFINDKWNAHANNCEFRWNPATGRVEVYALRDILLHEEFGSDYDAPFWYQRHNGLSTLAQAQQVRTYYQQNKPPLVFR